MHANPPSIQDMCRRDYLPLFYNTKVCNHRPEGEANQPASRARRGRAIPKEGGGGGAQRRTRTHAHDTDGFFSSRSSTRSPRLATRNIRSRVVCFSKLVIHPLTFSQFTALSLKRRGGHRKRKKMTKCQRQHDRASTLLLTVGQVWMLNRFCSRKTL